jgi:hypothetical protein
MLKNVATGIGNILDYWPILAIKFLSINQTELPVILHEKTQILHTALEF